MNAQEYRNRNGEYDHETPEGYALDIMNEIVAYALETCDEHERKLIGCGVLYLSDIVPNRAAGWVSKHWDDMQYIVDRDTLDYASCIMTIDTPYGLLEVETRGHVPTGFDPFDMLVAACDRVAEAMYESDLEERDRRA